MAKSLIGAPVPVPRLIPSVVNADPAVLARESTAHADAILRQSDRASAAQRTAATAATDATAARGSIALNVKTDFGAVGDGVVDDTAAIRAAILASPGITLRWPRGEYKVTSTLVITTTSNHWIGDFANRAAQGGTQITYYGSGPCIQIGTDNGHAWDANEYDGPQDQLFENIHILHGAPDTNLASTGAAGLHYKAGAYGIWDWRGGGIVLHRVGLEQFEANFVGIQSDINEFDVVLSLYSKYGIYIGPRSDQFTIRNLLSFFCDRAITIDGSHNTRIVDAQFVGVGTSTTAAIEIRLGSSAVWIERPWFEHLQGYMGIDQLSFVSAGEVSGYGAGGSIAAPGATPNTLPVEGASIDYGLMFSTAIGSPAHTKYAVSAGKCRRLIIHSPSVVPGSALSNFDALVGVVATQAPSITDTQIRIDGVNSDTVIGNWFVNLGAGAPAVAVWGDGAAGTTIFDRFSLTREFKLLGEIVPGILGASQNDWNPTGLATCAVILASSSVPINITGLAVGFVPAFAGRKIWLYNIGAQNITLTNQDPASVNVDRFITRGGAAMILTPNTGVELYYSPSQSRFIVMTDSL